jgi:photosystem II stability/assembly factor-like uncharacterized protein
MNNTDTGFAVGDQGIIIKTTDNGLSWFQIPSFTNIKLNSITKNSAYYCQNFLIAVGNNGLIFRSSDSGNNWVQDQLILYLHTETAMIIMHQVITEPFLPHQLVQTG